MSDFQTTRDCDRTHKDLKDFLALLFKTQDDKQDEVSTAVGLMSAKIDDLGKQQRAASEDWQPTTDPKLGSGYKFIAWLVQNFKVLLVAFGIAGGGTAYGVISAPVEQPPQQEINEKAIDAAVEVAMKAVRKELRHRDRMEREKDKEQPAP